MAAIARGQAEYWAEERAERAAAAKVKPAPAGECHCTTDVKGVVERCIRCWRASWDRGHAMPDPWE